jgi:hypothetical protein
VIGFGRSVTVGLVGFSLVGGDGGAVAKNDEI